MQIGNLTINTEPQAEPSELIHELRTEALRANSLVAAKCVQCAGTMLKAVSCVRESCALKTVGPAYVRLLADVHRASHIAIPYAGEQQVFDGLNSIVASLARDIEQHCLDCCGPLAKTCQDGHCALHPYGPLMLAYHAAQRNKKRRLRKKRSKQNQP